MRNNKDGKRKKIVTIVISIVVLIVVLLGMSYAFFSTQLSGKDQIVRVGELELVLNETSEGISLDKAIGVSDEEGMSLTPSTFTLKNNGSKAVDYTIYIDDNSIGDTDTRIEDKYLKYNLKKNGLDSGATLLTKTGVNPNRILDSGTIEGKGANEYSLNLWITDEVDGNYSGQVFSGKLRVEVSQERDKSVATVVLDKLKEDDFKYDDGENTIIRGEDPNNYIWYSGKLWRAVSVNNETRTVKLVTQWNVNTISYNGERISDFAGSYIEEWLNDTSVDGFLGSLRDPEKFIVMDSKWDATENNSELGNIARPNGTTLVTDAVGLLNSYEYDRSWREITDFSKGYLNNGLYWWTLTPINENVRTLSPSGSISQTRPTASVGVRPAINLQSNVKIVSGDGTETNPYRLQGDNDNSLKGTLLNTRYSGEYIRFGTDENNLYRIVSHETAGLTKITSAYPLKDSGVFKTISFGGSNSIYSNTNTIGSFLNGEYLTSGEYLTTEQVNMIEENTTWYLGTVPANEGYKLAKYTDTTGTTLTSDIVQAKVGLLRHGELMSGQFDYQDNNIKYLTLTPMNYIGLRHVEYTGDGTYGTAYYHNDAGIRPTLNLKSNVVITGGSGTKQDPFKIKLL